MSNNPSIAIICLALAFVITLALPLYSVAAEERADQACENQNEREARFDIKTEPDSTSPTSDSGVFHSYEGTYRSLGDCPRT